MTECCNRPLWRNRCTGCGHRQPVNGCEPIATRYFPKRLWLTELRLRRQARKAATA